MKKILFILFCLFYFTPILLFGDLAQAQESTPSVLLEKQRINIWPLFYFSGDKDKKDVTLSLFTPLIYYNKTDDGKKEYGLRPLFYVTDDKNSDKTVVDFIYPFGKYTREGEYKKFRLFPFIKDQRDVLAGGKKRTSHDYPPFYWGTSEDDEPYFGIFPLFGTVKKRFGHDEIFFLFWPIYSRTVEDGFTTNKVLSPIFSYTTGDSGWGVKVFPLFIHKEITGSEYQTSILFPLITFSDKYLDTENPLIERMVLPLFSVQKTPHSRSTTVLWPFFTYAADKNYNYRKYDFPWPFLSITRSDILNITQIAPLYRSQVRTERDTIESSMYLLYPIYKEDHLTTPSKIEDTYRFMLIDKYKTTRYLDGREELWVYFFPLYNRQTNADGDDSSVILYPLPLYDDGFKRNLLPIFELYRREKHGDESETVRILHHLYIKEIRNGVEYIDIPFFFFKK